MKTIKNVAHQEHHKMYTEFHAGKLTTKEIVGTGFKYPRGVAGAHLLKEMHNTANPDNQVDSISVKADGHPFITELLAKRSAAHKKLVAGNYTLFSDGKISDFGIMPAPGGIEGFVVYINLEK
jgi:hypothetical protein